MEPKIADSLERIVEYLFRDKIRDWEERGKPRKHIYCDVRRVGRWLGKMAQGKPESGGAR